MKNKKFISIINLFIVFFFTNLAIGEQFDFKSSEIIFLENGNKIKGVNGIDLETDNKIRITGEQFDYDKINAILNIKGDVVVYDEVNKLVLKSNEFTYLKDQEIIFTKSKTIIEFNNEYFLDTKELTFDRNKKNIYSEKKTYIKDLNGNLSSMSKFNFSLTTKLLNGDDINYLDTSTSQIFIKKGIINLATKEIAGKDPVIKFENTTFGNKENEPRLKGNSVYSNKENTNVKKATFTTCKKTDGCPPWTLTASEVSHDKKKQIIYYKDTWLKLYDYPIFYFPKFFHPDPTVKRQSGFLIPKFNESNLTGSSINIPYFSAISDNKDMTFNPTFFSNSSALIQTEYRQVNKSSKHNIDTSYFTDENKSNKRETKSHFFSSSTIELDINNFDTSILNIDLQGTSNDTYLKKYDVKSPLIENESLLHSIIEFNGSKNNSSFNISTEIYEDLTKRESDRYEYILPSFDYIKNIYPKDIDYGYFSIESKGHQKQNNTNINEISLINELYFNSYSLITDKGFKNKYVGLIKNVNSDIENSNNDNKNETKLLTALMYEMTYPVKKEMEKYDNIFTPIISFRYSPNETRNLRNSDRRIDTNNIYSIDRLGEDSSVEGGQSITLGSSFKKIDKSDKDIITFDLATTFRDVKNEDMPLTTTMGDKHSDFVGNFVYNPNKVFNLSYDFSFDNNLKHSNFDSLKAGFNVNNFVTEFEFMEENNLIGSDSYLANKSTFNFDKEKSISFGTRRNRKTNLTEYYDLMYEYKNDCLIAAIQYKKEYYSDRDLKPEEQLFFSLTIVPFSKTNSPNLNK
jgi:LPS-assembly protein